MCDLFGVACVFRLRQTCKGVLKIDGVSYEIHIHVLARLSDASLRDLLGLFQRYKVEIRPFPQSVTADGAWFRKEHKFWFKKSFL